VSLASGILLVARAAVLGIFIALFGKGIWSAILIVNLKTSPSIPSENPRYESPAPGLLISSGKP